MLNNNERLPEEDHEQTIRDLRKLYNTHQADQSSLARIRERMLQKSSEMLPIVDRIDMRIPESLLIKPLEKQQISPEIDRHRFPIHTQRIRQPGTLVAGLLLAMLVGSLMVTLLHLQHTTNQGQGLTQTTRPIATEKSEVTQPKFYSGWKFVKDFQGTGNQTITDIQLDINGDSSYGVVISCSKDSFLNIELDPAIINTNGRCEPDRNIQGGPSEYIVQPQYRVNMVNVYPNINYHAPLRKITVTVNANISWHLFLVERPHFIPLKPAPNERLLIQQRRDEENAAGPIENINIALPTQGWKMSFRCYGEGTISVGVNIANSETGINTMGTCGDGLTHISLYQTNLGAQAKGIQVITSKSNAWDVMITACAENTPNCYPSLGG
jgi:hypothetical protein